jgi:hypothetical protein
MAEKQVIALNIGELDPGLLQELKWRAVEMHIEPEALIWRILNAQLSEYQDMREWNKLGRWLKYAMDKWMINKQAKLI